jgi:uncharacterized cupredoxin-like copper-binding protein
MWKRFTSLFTLLVAVLLVTAACSSTGDASAADPVAQDDETTQETDHDEAEEADHDEATGDVDRVVEVDMSEFAFAADSFEFTPGETVEFVITNSGVAEHEFRLSNLGRVDEHIAGGHADHDDAATDDEEADHDDAEGAHDDEEADHDDAEGAHDDEEADHDDAEGAHDDEEAGHDDGAEDVVLVLGAGESGTIVFTFPENDHDYTAVVCLIPGHYEAGMAVDLSYTS